MRRVLLLCVAVAAAGAAVWLAMGRRAPALPAAGIPVEFAVDRARRVSALRYEATFRVPATRTDPVSAHLRATFQLSDASDDLPFDFAQPVERLLALHANGWVLPPAVTNDHVINPAGELVEGENIVEFEFLAGDAALNRQEEFLYALFVPARASQTMPVFDQPDLKARWRLILNIPPDWIAIANAGETGRVASPDHLGLIFEETAPISTYLFAFAAGKFVAEDIERDGRRFRMLHREPDAAKVARNRDAIVDLHA
jgi:aminopeptidase N